MRTPALLALLLLAAAPLAAQEAAPPAAVLSDEEVAQAIAEGRAKPGELVGLKLGALNMDWRDGICRVLPAEPECRYRVLLQGPAGRIATEAGRAAAKYLPFTPDSVAPESRTRIFSFTIDPVPPAATGSGWSVPAEVQHVVVQTRAQREARAQEAIQPLSIQLYPVQWNNAQGGVFQGQGALVYFDVAQIPAGDFDLVIVTRGGEVRTRVPARYWQRNAALVR